MGHNGLEMDKGISVVDAHIAIVGGREEVAGKGEGGRGVEEGEGGDGTIMVH